MNETILLVYSTKIQACLNESRITKIMLNLHAVYQSILSTFTSRITLKSEMTRITYYLIIL